MGTHNPNYKIGLVFDEDEKYAILALPTKFPALTRVRRDFVKDLCSDDHGMVTDKLKVAMEELERAQGLVTLYQHALKEIEDK